MSIGIWYVSKYVALPSRGTVGSRGYCLMKELEQMGAKISIITSDSNHLASPPNLNSKITLETIDGLQICWLKTFKYKTAKSLRRILSWFHFEWRLLTLPKRSLPRPDVIIVSSLSLLTVLTGIWWRYSYQSKLIFEVRDIWPLTILEEGGFRPWNPFVWILGVIEQIGYKYADIIVGTMPNLGEHVQSVLGYQKTTYCIPMGVELERFTKSDEIPIEYLDKYIPREKFLVAHVGTIGITNALETFFKCAESMQNRCDIHFLLVGDGDLKEHYQSKFRNLQNLTFAPKVSKTMVPSVLAHCDLLYFAVHVSRVWRYGQSLNKVIDYMLAGKPVVASFTGYPSMINESGCGTFVPAGDVLALCKEVDRYSRMNHLEREQIGRRGKEWLLQNRQYKTLAADYLNVIWKVLAKDNSLKVHKDLF
jgi:glycosyltransferase involved in cell wall biosynthesis